MGSSFCSDGARGGQHRDSRLGELEDTAPYFRVLMRLKTKLSVTPVKASVTNASLRSLTKTRSLVSLPAADMIVPVRSGLIV